MKKPTQLIIISAIVILLTTFVGFSYYSNYKKKNVYQKALIADLEQVYRHLELSETPETQEIIDEFDKVMESVSYTKILRNNDSIKVRYAYYINEFNQKLKYKMFIYHEYKNDNVWKYTQLSGVLSQFSKRELEKLQDAYTQREEFKNIKKEIQKLANYYVPYDTKTTTAQQIISAYRNTHYLLKEEQSILFLVKDRCRRAIEELDPENATIRKIDSLQKNQTDIYKSYNRN